MTLSESYRRKNRNGTTDIITDTYHPTARYYILGYNQALSTEKDKKSVLDRETPAMRGLYLRRTGFTRRFFQSHNRLYPHIVYQLLKLPVPLCCSTLSHIGFNP